jgi:hypothetical protein
VLKEEDMITYDHPHARYRAPMVWISAGGVARPLVGSMTTSYEPRLAKPIVRPRHTIAAMDEVNPLLQMSE